MKVPNPLQQLLKEATLILIKVDGQEVRYYTVPEVAKKITKNKWDMPVDGVHSETIRRAVNDNPEVGRRVTGGVYLSEDDVEKLGYKFEDTDTYVTLGDIVQLYPLENE